MSPSDLKRDILARSSPLVSAEELELLSKQPGLKLFDVRGTWSSPARALPDDYEMSHIPGAAFLDWTRRFIDQSKALPLASVADRDAARSAFKALGVNATDLVVLYDNYHHMLAGRVWWAMRYWGFDNVRVLNGGWVRWTKLQKPVTSSTAEVSQGDFEPVQRGDWRTSLEDFIENHQKSCVIDARGSAGYAGNADDPRTGHIPGSLNIPFSELLDRETGLFLNRDALSDVLDEKAPQWRERPIIATCGSGYAATVTLLALTELGNEARLFDGSFSAWKQDPARPVEQTR
ncbi:3-mercaptopyruvate sulfurtransferase [Labrenzia sp. THAF82]|uniref:sulfurtransferase n=1 Tax=Labrenzia sp. THAF82 TaxID=2587861 RepID=UPI0012A8BC6C|nr:rhodanese-like domain-containing protein [Labrenzia sp. THAF82]QFT34642.1 3-mercaptopyruvate sulfurtransferase [Labrenzia sp. THAF82]